MPDSLKLEQQNLCARSTLTYITQIIVKHSTLVARNDSLAWRNRCTGGSGPSGRHRRILIGVCAET